VHPSLRREETWKKLSAETCLLNFYFQQGSRQQLWGANALKAQGWRFHTQVGLPRRLTGCLVALDTVAAAPPARCPAPTRPARPQFNAWFARQSTPRTVTETHETGPLIFFDFNLWARRRLGTPPLPASPACGCCRRCHEAAARVCPAPLPRHNVSQGSGLLPSAPQYSGWCPRVSRPDFMFGGLHTRKPQLLPWPARPSTPDDWPRATFALPPPPPNSPPGRVQVHGAGGHVGAQRPVSTPLSSTALRASLLQARKAGAGGRLRSQPALSLLALATSKDAPLAWPWERQHSAKRAAVEAAMPCT
jgi:hypothetical protein